MTFDKYIPSFRTSFEKYNFRYKFTVFTPVYNREDTIYRVFDSLNKQSFTDFELIIINDGSTDNSHKKISELLKTVNFEVTYINNHINRHKMACYFQAIDLARGEFLIILDSDDRCTESALQVFRDVYDSIPDHKINSVSGISALCKDQSGKLIGEKFPKNHYYSNTFRQNLYHSSVMERWGFTKTEVLKNIKVNPEIFSRGLIPEGIIWELIASQGYETLYINRVLRVYYLDTHNRLSNRDHKKNSFGMALYSLSVINWFANDYFLKKPLYFIKRIYTLLRAAYYLDYEKKEYVTLIPNRFLKSLFIIGWYFKHLLK